jgi:hypothetical protein
LFEAGLKNDKLNLLYLENTNTKVAIKVNNRVTRTINMKDIEMQGSVWSSLKCVVSMDKVNKVMLADESLAYKYRGDPDILLGVLGMVDDTLAVGHCGIQSIKKNAVMNSFIEQQRLTLSQSKSVVLHIGRKSKCLATCPTLKVQDTDMKTADSVRYLGDIISASGARRPSVDDRRSTGWARVSEITAMLTAMPDKGKVQVGLKLREAKLLNGILYSIEAWNNMSDKEYERLEQVDMAALRALVGGGHSRCPKAFYYLEFGTLMVRHVIMIKRLSYHHHIITRDDSELIKKIYLKQKEDPLKGDWIHLIQKDYEFIQEDLNDDFLKSIPKDIFLKQVKEKVTKAAFKSYLLLKETNKTKMKQLTYDKFQMQEYLSCSDFN